jgi:arginyl-tRNA synthetase
MRGAEIVNEHTGEVFVESEGAIIFKGEDYDKKLHTRVFINSAGLPTYEAKELGLAYAKKDECNFDLSITVTANEIDTYFKVVKTALAQFDGELANRLVHISHGVMKLPTGKMSSRTGDVVTAEELIKEVKKAVLDIESERDIQDKDRNAEIIAIAALKYMILRQASSKDIVYDLERSISFEGDSGPYLQYAYTRANSILERARYEQDEVAESNAEVSEFEKLLYRFPQVIVEAQEHLEPHRVTTYLTELSGAFNSFYARERIIGGDNERYNLALVRAFQIVMSNGLYLLGIGVPKRM